jgi:hypothetical protein
MTYPANCATVVMRAQEVLYSAAYAGDQVGRLLDATSRLGPVAVFGGLLRDLWTNLPTHFASDIDLVIDTKDLAGLGVVLRELGGKRNRYGGFRLNVGKWPVDIWGLHDTWAFREGIVQGGTFSDLTRTTFFNWDAIVLDLKDERLYCGTSYAEDIEARMLELNLEANANPAGNVIRTIEQYVVTGASLGPRLAEYVYRFLRELYRGKTLDISLKYRKRLVSPVAQEVYRKLERHLRMGEGLLPPCEPTVGVPRVRWRGLTEGGNALSD